MCRFGTAWRKRFRIATDTGLAGIRELCLGGHSHQILRGRSAFHQHCWTRLAQTYPVALAKQVATAVWKRLHLSRFKNCQLNQAACARAGHARIGEAKSPGPRRAVRGAPARLCRSESSSVSERLHSSFAEACVGPVFSLAV